MKQFNKKTLIHSIILAVGIGGILHLVSLFIIGLFKQDLRYFNPAYAIDIDQLLPASNNQLWFMVAGWLGLASIVIAVYYFLSRLKK
ncbi:MAG: hypothetical protein WCJ60_02885 [bacterium]